MLAFSFDNYKCMLLVVYIFDIITISLKKLINTKVSCFGNLRVSLGARSTCMIMHHWRARHTALRLRLESAREETLMARGEGAKRVASYAPPA